MGLLGILIYLRIFKTGWLRRRFCGGEGLGRLFQTSGTVSEVHATVEMLRGGVGRRRSGRNYFLELTDGAGQYVEIFWVRIIILTNRPRAEKSQLEEEYIITDANCKIYKQPAQNIRPYPNVPIISAVVRTVDCGLWS